ncbi:hypothetical protein BIW11_00696 [Tropilaelaps mercedesae]|uniref:Uncharacterized protein n=1 Tax=Tropilaelaps mercedesae TaxID=418985 RepID=A0A1V9XQT3_9ACAR|nr:hypothetical protein BIW11_00696 [Tropilaelaps mercedesae]
MLISVRVSFVVLALAIGAIHYAESKKLLKLAAAAAIIRGGPIIPIPVRYPVHVPHSKIVKVAVHHPVPVKVPVHHHTHSVKKVPIPVHSHSVSEKHVPVPIPIHSHSHSHTEKHIALPVHHKHGNGHVSFGDLGSYGGGFDGGYDGGRDEGYGGGHGFDIGNFDGGYSHNEIGHGGLIADINFGGHGW